MLYVNSLQFGRRRPAVNAPGGEVMWHRLGFEGNLTSQRLMAGERSASRTGQASAWREPQLPQPGGRDPAPRQLALVQAFVNTHYDLELEHGADLFATPAALEAWMARRGLSDAGSVTDADVRRVVAVREGLRAMAATNAAGAARGRVAVLDELNHAARGAALEVRFSDAPKPRFVPGRGSAVDRMLAIVLAITARAMLEGEWGRLKVCPGEHCGWAFYDHSRNQSGRWCSMSVCGGRVKARAHYRRRRNGGE
jgi:predicted RNA-binding Zn ribbon-like protein